MDIYKEVAYVDARPAVGLAQWADNSTRGTHRFRNGAEFTHFRSGSRLIPDLSYRNVRIWDLGGSILSLIRVFSLRAWLGVNSQFRDDFVGT